MTEKDNKNQKSKNIEKEKEAQNKKKALKEALRNNLLRRKKNPKQ